MSPGQRRGRGGRGRRGREAYQRQIAASPESATGPAASGSFDLDSPDGTAAQTKRGERIRLQPIPTGRRRRRRPRWPWQTIWTAVAAIVAAVVLLGSGISSVVWNAAGLKSLEEKHNAFVTRVGDDFKRLQDYIDKRISEVVRDGRRDNEPPPRRK